MVRLLTQRGLATVTTNVWFGTLVVGAAGGPAYATPAGYVGFVMPLHLETQLQPIGRVQVFRDDGLLFDDPNLTDGELAPGYGWVPVDRQVRWTFTNNDPMLSRWFKSKVMIAWVDRAAWQEILDNLFTSIILSQGIAPR